METYISNSTKETEKIAEDFAKKLNRGDVIAYEGPMGMGKTAFTRGLCRGLGIDDSDVSSPTFALVHEYKGDGKTLYHFDMYRIDTMDDLYSTGFFDYLDTDGILAIEWSENINSALPKGTIYVTIESVNDDENKRKITIKGDDRFWTF